MSISRRGHFDINFISSASNRPFHVLIRLQFVRQLVADAEQNDLRTPRSLNDVVEALRSVAAAAAEGNLTGYAQVCTLMIEALEVLTCKAVVTPLILSRLGEWAASSELYLRRPHYRPFARMVVHHLDDLHRQPPISHEHQVQLIDQMAIEPAFERSTR